MCPGNFSGRGVAKRVCRNCFQDLRPDDRFCPSCGRSVLQTAVVPTPEADTSVPPLPSPPCTTGAENRRVCWPRARRGGSGCVGCVLLVLIIALVIALVLGRGEAAAWLFVVLLIGSPVGAVIGRVADRGRTAPSHSHRLRAMPYKEYLRTPHWKCRREEKLHAAGRRCQVCNRSSVPLEVHHRTYERLGEELDGDLTVLCRDCHSTFHEHRRLGH